MIQPRDFDTIEAFIEHLKTKPNIIAILQYGSRDYRNMELGGDFDVNVIVNTEIESNIGGLHFHINQIPVDCGIIHKEDLYADSPPSDYHCVLLNSEVIYDASGEISQRLEKLKEAWKMNIPPIKEGEVAFERFIKQHIIDKFEHRAYQDETYSRLFLSGNIFWLLEAYMKIEQLNPYDFKGALEKMKMDDFATYQLFQAFEMTHDLDEKLALTKQLNEAVLAKVGGPWKTNEILFHYKDDSEKLSKAEMEEVIELIF